MADPIYRIGYSDLLQIAVGANGLILVSNDSGGSWLTVSSGTTETLYGIAYGAFDEVYSAWVAVGANGTVLRSEDGYNWSVVTPFTASHLYDVNYMGVFITVGAGGLLALSDNLGQGWVEKTSGTTNDLYDIDVNFGYYIITGANDTVITGFLHTLDPEVLIYARPKLTDIVSVNGIFNHDAADSFQLGDSVGTNIAGQRVEFELSGTAEVGDSYTITIDGVDYTYTLVLGDTLEDVATELAALIDATAQFAATADGTTVIVTSFDPPVPFTYSSSFLGPSVEDSAITTEFTASVTFAWGTVEAGDVFTVTVNGVDYDYTTLGSETLADVIADISGQLIAAGYTTSINSNVLTISDDTTFTISSAATNGGANADESATVTDYTNNYTVTGTVGPTEVGDVYTITINGVDYTYTTDGTETNISEVRDALAALIDAAGNLSASVVGNEIVVTETTQTAFTSTTTTTDGRPVDDSAITTTLTNNSSSTIFQVTVLGTPEENDIYTITINGVDYTYTVQAGDTLDDIAAELAALVDASPDFIATSTGPVITITHANPAQFLEWSLTATNGGVIDDQALEDQVIAESNPEGMTFYEWVTETLYQFDTLPRPNGIYNSSVTEDIEFLTGGPANFIASPTITETIQTTDESSGIRMIGFGGDITLPMLRLTGSIQVGIVFTGTIVLPALSLSGRVSSMLAGDLVLPMPTITGTFAQAVTLEGNIALPRLRVDGNVYFAGIQAQLTEIWVANALTAAHSKYTNYACNGLVKFNGKWVASFADGIYELGGNLDNTDKIAAKVYWVPSDLGNHAQKRIDSLSVNIRSINQSAIKIVAIADEQEKRTFTKDIGGRPKGIHRHRQLLPKGLNAQTWQFGIENMNGGDFVLDEIEVITVELSRRFK